MFCRINHLITLYAYPLFLLAWNENLREWDLKKNVTMTEKK